MISTVTGTLIALCFVLGIIGTIIPGLPGIGLIFAGILWYAFLTDFSVIGLYPLLFFAFLTLLALASDWVGSYVGIKMVGGMRGALIGTIVGIFVGIFIPGGFLAFLISPLIGALLGAMLHDGMDTIPALRVALMSTLGMLAGTVAQLLIGMLMIAAFLLLIILR